MIEWPCRKKRSGWKMDAAAQSIAACSTVFAVAVGLFGVRHLTNAFFRGLITDIRGQSPFIKPIIDDIVPFVDSDRRFGVADRGNRGVMRARPGVIIDDSDAGPRTVTTGALCRPDG